jgi:hypothetical protein
MLRPPAHPTRNTLALSGAESARNGCESEEGERRGTGGAVPRIWVRPGRHTAQIHVTGMLLRTAHCLDVRHRHGAVTSRGRACGPVLMASIQPLMNASRSALIVSACVVGMPCGNPLYVFSPAQLHGGRCDDAGALHGGPRSVGARQHDQRRGLRGKIAARQSHYPLLKEELEAGGLKFVSGGMPTGVVLPDGRSLVFSQSRDENAAAMNALAPSPGARRHGACAGPDRARVRDRYAVQLRRAAEGHGPSSSWSLRQSCRSSAELREHMPFDSPTGRCAKAGAHRAVAASGCACWSRSPLQARATAGPAHG